MSVCNFQVWFYLQETTQCPSCLQSRRWPDQSVTKKRWCRNNNKNNEQLCVPRNNTGGSKRVTQHHLHARTHHHNFVPPYQLDLLAGGGGLRRRVSGVWLLFRGLEVVMLRLGG